MRSAKSIFVLFALPLVSLVACGSEDGAAPAASLACAPGQLLECPCRGTAEHGVQECKADGSGYGACQGCEQGSAGQSGAGGKAAAGSGGTGNQSGQSQAGQDGSAGSNEAGAGPGGSGQGGGQGGAGPGGSGPAGQAGQSSAGGQSAGGAGQGGSGAGSGGSEAGQTGGGAGGASAGASGSSATGVPVILLGEITGATGDEEVMIADGIKLANETMATGCFKAFILAASWTETNGLTQEQIYEKLASGPVTVNVDMYLGSWYENHVSKTIGYEDEPGTVHMNRYFVDTSYAVADNVIHEAEGHSQGFSHYGVKATSVPYGLNDAFEACAPADP